MERFFTRKLFARANSAGESAVINTVIRVPQWLPEFDATTEDFDLLLRTGWCVGWQKVVVDDWVEVFVMTVLENCFKNVLAQITH